MKHRNFVGIRFAVLPTIVTIVLIAGANVAAAASGYLVCHFSLTTPDHPQLMFVSRAAAASHVRVHNDELCAPGTTDCCMRDSSGSACTNVDSDHDNCGQCGVVCGADQECVGGVCLVTCPEGQSLQ